jgi:amino acid adenylation domain-containing protein
VLVGILVERSLEMVVGLLGVLKAGGAYVPLDAGYPRQRLEMMVADSGAAVVLTQARLQELVEERVVAVVCLDADWELIARESAAPVKSQVQSENLAYVIYTSGSTGQPKGVMVSHRNVANFFVGMSEAIDGEQPGVWLAVTSISFDISVLELFWTLTEGFQVVVQTEQQGLDRDEDNSIIAQIRKHRVTHMQCTPSLIRMMNIEPEALGSLENIRTLLLGGEALPPALAKQLRENFSGDFHNMYGPTETTIWSTTYRIDKVDGIVSIGRPIANTNILILDRQFQLVPIGVPGEIYIGGAGVVRGYWRRPDLTAERFVPALYGSERGARLYRTGDLARYLPDGNIEYLRRLDHQVKLRGHRIELGEIESVLGDHSQVKQSVVIVREDNPGEPELVAYVVGMVNETPDASELRRHLKERLPDYMVPTAFVVMEELPLTPNGKVDRRALPAPDRAAQSSAIAFVAPRSPEEAMMANIWAEVLHIEQVGVNHNFFELGGHSLLATQLVSRIGKSFNVELPLRTVFESPTVAELSAVVLQKQLDELGSEVLAQMSDEIMNLSEEELTALLESEKQLIGQGNI